MNIEMIRAAAQRLEGQARRTPLLNSAFVDEIAGRRVWVKAEALQHTGSFKMRGAASKMTSLTDKQGLITASSGNHGIACARAASIAGLGAVRRMRTRIRLLARPNICAQ